MMKNCYWTLFLFGLLMFSTSCKERPQKTGASDIKAVEAYEENLNTTLDSMELRIKNAEQEIDDLLNDI